MAGFTKLFSVIITSTIWREKDTVRIVWITMLAMATKTGAVEASVPGLAVFANVSLEECEEALELLRKPDAYSRTKDNEGRRIADTDGGWMILNYAKYRNRLSVDDRREYQRIKQMEYRAKKKGLPLPGQEAFVKAIGQGDEKAAERVLEEHLPERAKVLAVKERVPHTSALEEDPPVGEAEEQPPSPPAQPAANVPRDTIYAKQPMPLRESKQNRSDQLPRLPRQVDEELAENSPAEAQGTLQEERSELRPRIEGPRENRPRALPNVRQPEGGNAPSQLAKAAASDMAVPAVPPATAPERRGEAQPAGQVLNRVLPAKFPKPASKLPPANDGRHEPHPW